MSDKVPEITTRTVVHGYSNLPKELRGKVDDKLREWDKQRKSGEWTNPYKKKD